MKKDKTNGISAFKVSLTGVFAALCVIVSLIERVVTAGLPLPPGIKPGLGNVCIMLVCFIFGPFYAFSIVLIKSFFLLLVSGVSGAFISVSGGILSVSVMYLLYRFCSRFFGSIGISVAGALSHNAGQLIAASVLVGSGLYINYAPVLLLSGTACGVLTGIILNFTEPAVKKYISARK